MSALEIEREEIDVKGEYLLTLFHQEMSTCSWMKWSSLDHALEKFLQWPLLSVRDLGSETKSSVWRRVRPAERSILIKSTWGLIKAYAVQGFVRGLELGLFTSIHIFIYSMLFYRLVKLIQTGSTNIDEFRASFISSDQKGIDSLVRLLAGLEAQWLKFILTSPLIIGGLQGISSLWGAQRTSSNTLKNYPQIINTHLQTGGSWLRDGLYEYLPGISSIGFLSLSGKLQKLESLVRWDGRLSSEERRKIFDALCEVAVKGKKSTQLNALTNIAKIAHGIGFKDLSRLKEAGYSTEELITILYTKGKALELLTALRKEEAKESKPLRCQSIQSLPQRLYRQYLLWWLLGLKTHVLKQQLPALLFKGIKLTIEFYFFQMLFLSILEAIRCPDKPGYQFGNGYQDWAANYTAECFTTRLTLFRTIDIKESVDALVSEIPQYHLTELISLDLSLKFLTLEEASQIIQAVIQQKAHLKTLDLSGNQLTAISNEIFNGLTQLNSLDLYYNQLSTLSDGIFSGLSQLNYLDLSSNRLTTLSDSVFSGLSQLNYLDLSYNYQLSTLSDGVFSELSQLNYLDLNPSQLSVLNEGIFSRLSQLNYLSLGSNWLSTLSESVFSSLSQLNYLELGGNLSTLSDGVFSRLSQLNYLKLGGTQLSTLSGSVFSGLSQLNYLDLSFNHKLSTLSDGVFSSLSQLNQLRLYDNQLSTLSKGIFNGLNQLNYLDLGANLLSTISDDVFYGLNKLQFLNLNRSRIDITNVLTQLPPSLIELDISLTVMKYIPQNFSTLFPISLQSLSIGGNYIPKTLTREFMQNFPPVEPIKNSIFFYFQYHSKLFFRFLSIEPPRFEF